MKYRVVVTSSAKRDLFQTVAWWGEHRSFEQAERWYAGIVAAIDTLSDRPARCPVSPEDDLLPSGLWQLHFGVGRRTTHRIVFTVVEEEVRVLRVRHTAQQDLTPDDLEQHF